MHCPHLLLASAACLALMTLNASMAAPKGGIRPVRLRCEQAIDPLGIDARQPRLGWVLELADAADRGQRQTAYQVLVASSPERLERHEGDLWDSGRVPGAESVAVAYAGAPLRSGQRVYWKVRAWDREGRPSGWSATAWWEMGLLEPSDWKGRWVRSPEPPPVSEAAMFAANPAPLLRAEFQVAKPVARARAYVTGLGYYELRLNGRKVGDHVLDPGWTTYSRRVLYSTYDVTFLLHPGRNAVGMMLGGGWYDPVPLRLFGRFNLREILATGRPRGLLHLEILYADGSRQVVGTDEGWRAHDGPIVKNSVYLGEEYDSRREQPGWDTPGFDDGQWKPAAPATEPLGPLQAQSAPPIRVMRSLKPMKVTEPKPGVFIFDLGQNFAGWVTLRARGERGTRITLRYGELLYPDGTLNPMTSVAGQIKGRGATSAAGGPVVAVQSDAYVLMGEGQEEYTPRFTFHGFRYVEVTGYPGTPALDALEGHLLHSAVESAGSFTCSDPLYNRIQEVVRWTQLSNMFSVQSDCPHREKLGYGGDIVATSDMAMLNWDMSRFYAKVARDFADAVRPNGGFTETAPFVGIADAGLGEGAGPVGWGTAHPLLVWQLYQYYGDRRLLAEQYPLAVRWLELLRSRAKDGILENGISDHESLVPKPVALTGTAFYYYNARLLARMARALEREEDARNHDTLAGEIREAFNRRFLSPGGKYDTGTQACQAFALFMGLAPAAEEAGALDVLVKDVAARDGHLTTGIFGTKYMLDALSARGRADVAATVVGQKTFPGWGWMLQNGATTLWEHWAFSDNTFSHNHPMFGSVSEWFFKVPGGICPDPNAAGFDRILLRPQPVGGLAWARARYESVRGTVVSEWERGAGGFSYRVSIPVGATSRVFVPASGAATVTEGDRPASEAPGVRFLRMERDAAVFEVEAGNYVFKSP